VTNLRSHNSARAGHCARVKWTATAVLGCIVLAACGGGSSKSATSGSTSATVAPVTTSTQPKDSPTNAELRAALLTVDDMPSGWAVSPPDKSTSEDSPWCPEAGGAQSDLSKGGFGFSKGESITFVQGTIAPVILEIVTVDRSNANQRYDTAVNEARKCEGKTWTGKDSDGTVSTYVLTPESFDKYGDETHAWRLTIKSNVANASVDLVFIRKGDAIIVMGGVGLVSIISSAQMDPKVLSEVTATAVDKVDF
jgi:hypothetical protein